MLILARAAILIEMAKILLVEDYDSIRDVYLFALREEGFETDTARSGAQALELVLAKEYDLICLDMVMMEFSGLEFLAAWRAKQPRSTTRVIVLSNIDSPKIVERAKALGIQQYLVKSRYTPRELVAVVKAELAQGPLLPASDVVA